MFESPRPHAEIARSFRNFAPHCRIGSPLYEQLSLAIAEDDALLELAAQTRAGQPPPNMLFGAVHYLLLRGTRHPLAAYYPTVGGGEPPGPDAFAAFREFCLSRREPIGHLLATRLTQTNETRRCSYLLPAFQTVYMQADHMPLALIEIGPSAGLNMAWDRYAYDYGNGLTVGDPDAGVLISTELRGGRPPIPTRPPAVAWRLGVDLNPVDLENRDEVRWLEGLIWPDQLERMNRLRAAMSLVRAARLRIVAGDALALLPGLLAEAPGEAVLCVYHTHVTYQFSPAMREQLHTILDQAAVQRPIYRLSCEHDGAHDPHLLLTIYAGGRREERVLALTTGHANWIEWL